MDYNFEIINAISERKVLFAIIEMLMDGRITIEEIQFKNNSDKEIDSEDERWFNYVEKDGWIFQGHKYGKRIRLINPNNVRVAKAPKKDEFIKECRKLLSQKGTMK